MMSGASGDGGHTLGSLWCPSRRRDWEKRPREGHVRNMRGDTPSVGVKPFLPMKKGTAGGYGQVSPSITVRYLQSNQSHPPERPCCNFACT